MNLIFIASTLKRYGLLVALLLLAMNTTAYAADVTCNGYTTLIYTNKKTALIMCHGHYTKIDRQRLVQWQACDDAMIQIRDKTTDKTTLYSNCLPGAGKQFRLDGNVFMLRHSLTTYPEFESQPLLIESLDFETNRKTYKFEKQFPACTRKDIDDAAQQIDLQTAKKFNGETYFSSVYGAFYKLRDCAMSDPRLVTSILHKYQSSDLFDGEVAETLNSVTDEIELINAAMR